MVDWTGLDLLAAYGWYLAFAFVATILARAHYYYALIHTFRDFQSRFPNLFRVVVGHVHLFFAWPHVLSVLVMLLILALHVTSLRYVFLDASVLLGDLVASWPLLLAVVTVGILMIGLDAHELLWAGPNDPPRLRVYLLLAEKAIASAGIVGLLSEGIVSRFLRRRILENTLLVNPWFRRWVRRIAVRLAFGLLLWGAWATGRV